MSPAWLVYKMGVLSVSGRGVGFPGAGVDSAGAVSAGVSAGISTTGTGVSVGMAALRVAAQSGVGEAFPDGAKNVGDGKLQLSNTSRMNENGMIFFTLALD